MKPEFKYSEYQQLFSTNGMSYLTSDIFMGYYKALGGMTIFLNDKWTSFLPKETITRTLQEGVRILSDEELFGSLKKDLDDYYKDANVFFEKTLANEKLSLEQCQAILDTLTKNYNSYSKTEFFYVDEAYRLKDQNPIIAKNLKEFESIKNSSRARTNAIFFMPGSHRKTFLKKISVQFDISLEHISSYGKSDILNLFSGIKLSEEDIKERESSYLMCGKTGEVVYLQGEEAKEVITGFMSGEKKEDVLKGIIVSKGKVTAPVTVIRFGNNAFSRLSETIAKMPQGNILVADTTGPELLLACKKASAILTNQGGMMSHAAIVSRELNIPCIVGLKTATDLLKDGDVVEVDAEKGEVKLLK
ncbi:MAG: PEP-utilizing enzyme [Patescibacteria group bacterium]